MAAERHAMFTEKGQDRLASRVRSAIKNKNAHAFNRWPPNPNPGALLMPATRA